MYYANKTTENIWVSFYFLSMATDSIAFTCWVDYHGIGVHIVCTILYLSFDPFGDWPLLRPYQISKSFHSFKIRVCLSNILMISSYFKQCAWPLYAVGSFNPFHILISNWNKIRAKWWNEWTKIKKKHCPQIVLWEHMAGNTESNWSPMYSEIPSKSRCNTGFKEHHCIMQRI